MKVAKNNISDIIERYLSTITSPDVMALLFHPKPGMIQQCDFSTGFKEPEMVKKRPVIVLSPDLNRCDLATVVAASTAVPDPIRPFHYRLPKRSMPMTGHFQQSDTWVKGDMIYTVSFERLNLIMLGKKDPKTGKRIYFQDRLGREQMKEIYTCVLHGMGLGAISAHL